MTAIDESLGHEPEVGRCHEVITKTRRDMHHLLGPAAELIEHVFEHLSPWFVCASFLGCINRMERCFEVRDAMRNQIDHRVRKNHQRDMRGNCLQRFDYIGMRLPGRHGLVQCERVGRTIFHTVFLACPLNRALNDIKERLPLT
ncbi:hypothetical protein D3C80_1279920 [compost metagenome]